MCHVKSKRYFDSILIDIEAMYQSFYEPTGTRVMSLSIAFWPPNVNLIVQ